MNRDDYIVDVIAKTHEVMTEELGLLDTIREDSLEGGVARGMVKAQVVDQIEKPVKQLLAAMHSAEVTVEQAASILAYINAVADDGNRKDTNTS